MTVNKATVLRIELSIPEGKPPAITSQTVIADGFGHRADKDVFLIGPTGLALAPDGTLYVSDALGNQIVAIPDATTRTHQRRDGPDRDQGRPAASGRWRWSWRPTGICSSTNAKNGQVVEVDPATGKQLYAQWIDANQAQSPPGNGDLFGIAMTPDGKGFYYVEDDVNTLVEATPMSRQTRISRALRRRGFLAATAGWPPPARVRRGRRRRSAAAQTTPANALAPKRSDRASRSGARIRAAS